MYKLCVSLHGDWRVTTNLGFKVTVFFNVTCLENGTRYRVIYDLLNGAIFATLCYASVAYAVMRCPSVCLSICRVCRFCQNEYLQIFFTVRQPHHSSFLYRTSWHYSDGTPTNRGVECRRSRQKS